MLTGLDHVIVAVADLDAAAEQVAARLGIEVGEGGRHPTLGTRNRLAWWGDTYLELVAIDDRSAAASSWFGAAVLAALAGVAGEGPGEAIAPPLGEWSGLGPGRPAPVGLALTSDHLDGDAVLTGLEVRGGERMRADGRVVRWRTARPAFPGSGAAADTATWPLIFLIEHDRAAAEWTEAERHARATTTHPLGTPVRLQAVSLAVASVPRAMGRLGRAWRLSFRPSLVGGGARDASLGNQTLRLVPARPDEPAMTVALRGGHVPRRVDLLGCRWDISPA